MTIPFTSYTIKNTTAIIILLGIVLIVAILLRLLTPERSTVVESIIPPQIQSNSNFSTFPTGVKIKEEYKAITVPSSFAVTPVSVRKRGLVDYTQRFNTTKQVTQTSYSSVSQDTTLTYDPTTQRILYTKVKREHLDVAQFLLIKTDQQLSTAQKFINETLQLQGFVPDREGITYYSLDSDGEYLNVDSEKNARVIAIPFVYELNGETVFIENQYDAPMLIYVDSTDTVIKADFTPFEVTLGKTEQVQSVSVSKALQTYTDGVITGLVRENFEKIEGKDVTELSVTSVEIQYRLDAASKSIIPMYVCKGTARTKQQDTSSFTFLLPAVQTNKQ